MNKETIARKNDIFRRTFIGGKVLLTEGVEHSEDLQKVIKAVQIFDDFSPDNDPYKEHDFGKVTINNEEYFFKIDYYDDEYQYFKEDGNRVMTIMLSYEY